MTGLEQATLHEAVDRARDARDGRMPRERALEERGRRRGDGDEGAEEQGPAGCHASNREHVTCRPLAENFSRTRTDDEQSRTFAEPWIAPAPEAHTSAWPRVLPALAAIALVACSESRSEPPAGDACAIPPMTQQYGGDEPPATFAPGVPAPACVTTKHDAIIVLGCPNEADGGASACQTARADLAVRAMRSGLGDDFVTTGGHVHNAWVEAETLRDLLVARGVARERITLEPKAEHTDENLYFSSRIMQARGWSTALVVSEDPRHLVMTAVCDANCCVRLGRLTIFDFVLAGLDGTTTGAATKLGHYELRPPAPAVTDEECETIRPKLMCLTLASRRACEGRVTLPP